ncbi:MAG: START domain-containing protein [Myxococcota bacterium]
MISQQRLALTCVALALVSLPLFALAEGKPKWEEITRDKGVLVQKKEIPGQDLPAFRGIATIKASVFDVLAVLDDTPRLTEWMHNCTGSKTVEAINDFERVTYNRTDAPWPVSDRDVVVRSKVSINAKRKIVTIRFSSINHAKMPEVEDVVRMPRLRGHYKLKILDENKTRVEYMVEANPGGSLPTWLVAKASEELPLQTLVNLRKQVKKTKGKYPSFVNKWDPEKGGHLPAEIMK